MYEFLTNQNNQSIRTMQSDELAMAIFGPHNNNLAIFESELSVSLNTRGRQLIISRKTITSH